MKTCKTCKHWQEDRRDNLVRDKLGAWGDCYNEHYYTDADLSEGNIGLETGRRKEYAGAFIYGHRMSDFITGPEYGCVHWKES